MTSRRAAASRTVRAIGPFVPRPSEPDPHGAGDTRPRAGLIPTSPQQEAGMRIEPPPSLACAIGQRAAAVAAAAPPLDPPAVRDVSQGLRHAPFSSDSVIPIVPNSGVFVLPRTTKPASRMRRTVAVSNAGTLPASAFVDSVVRRPAVSVRSLIEIGTPANGPERSSRAAASAPSASTVTYALSAGSILSIRSRY